MKCWLLAAGMFWLLPLIAIAQNTHDGKPQRYNVGINLITLYSGLPELQGEVYVNKYVGIAVAGGYTLRPAESGISVNAHADITSLKGGYVKLGAKGRYPFASGYGNVWLQALYVFSRYDEDGTVQTENKVIARHSAGTVHGIAGSGGIDLRVYRRFDFRVGLQIGSYNRNDELSSKATYQPGFGSRYFFIPMQGILGVTYRFGTL